MKPSRERAAPATTTVPKTPTPSFARKIMVVLLRGRSPDYSAGPPPTRSSRKSGLLLRVVRIDPDPDVLLMAGDGHQRHVAGICQRSNCRFDVELIVLSVRHQRLRDLPGH